MKIRPRQKKSRAILLTSKLVRILILLHGGLKTRLFFSIFTLNCFEQLLQFCVTFQFYYTAIVTIYVATYLLNRPFCM